MAEPNERAKPATSLKALLPLIPYARRYKGRIMAALGALTTASAATAERSRQAHCTTRTRP